MLAEVPNCPRDPLGVSERYEMTEPCALASDQESVDYLLDDEGHQNVTAFELIRESNQSHDGVEKIRVDRIHIHRFRTRITFFDLDVGFKQNRRNQRGIKIEA